MGVCADANDFQRWHEAGGQETPPTDVRIVTSDGQSVAAHSSVLASASPVLERLLESPRRGRNSERIIHLLGVPNGAVLAFVRFMYSSSSWMALTSREAEAAMEEQGEALLALAHSYRVRWLKRQCEGSIAARLSAANAVEVLKLAGMCDAPWLRQRCMGVVAKDFTAVQKSEGWLFVQQHDPILELEILQYLDEIDQRKRRWRRERANEAMYRMLSSAMECLQHIFTQGKKGPCTGFKACERLQLLIYHYATCDKKYSAGGCSHCRRMRKLFRLHSSLCDDQANHCKIPLCKHFKLKMLRDDKPDQTWRLLVKKVIAARVMAILADKNRQELVERSCLDIQHKKEFATI